MAQIRAAGGTWAEAYQDSGCATKTELVNPDKAQRNYRKRNPFVDTRVTEIMGNRSALIEKKADQSYWVNRDHILSRLKVVLDWTTRVELVVDRNGNEREVMNDAKTALGSIELVGRTVNLFPKQVDMNHRKEKDPFEDCVNPEDFYAKVSAVAEAVVGRVKSIKSNTESVEVEVVSNPEDDREGSPRSGDDPERMEVADLYTVP